MNPDHVALLWYMRSRHPDAAVRDAVSTAIQQQVEASRWADLRPQIREALRAERGTVLEPFVLDDGDIEMACELACMASEVARGLLVVSRDKLEPHGGSLLRVRDGAVESLYVERLASTHPIDTPDAWRFAPGLIPAETAIRDIVPGLKARVMADAAGYAILAGPFAVMPSFDETSGTARVAPGSAHGNMVRWRSERLIEGGQDWLALRPAAPEDAISLTASMIRQHWIELRPFAAPAGVDRLLIRLALPEGGATRELRTVRIIGDGVWDQLDRWLLTDNVSDVAERFGHDLLVELGAWLGLAPGWEDPELLERFT